MGQVLHGSATTTHAVRAAIRPKATAKELTVQYGLNPETVTKWKKRSFVHDGCDGAERGALDSLDTGGGGKTVGFRRHTLLPLDDCLDALQAMIPHLTRSSLHRLFQRHDISRLPEVEGEKATKKKFKSYPIGFFHIDIAEARTEEGKLYLFVAIDRLANVHRDGVDGSRSRRRSATLGVMT